MKKLTALLMLLSLGYFVVGCAPAEKGGDGAAAPAEHTDMGEAAEMPAEGAPAEEAAPAEAAPAEAAPAEEKPAEEKPAESKPEEKKE